MCAAASHSRGRPYTGSRRLYERKRLMHQQRPETTRTVRFLFGIERFLVLCRLWAISLYQRCFYSLGRIPDYRDPALFFCPAPAFAGSEGEIKKSCRLFKFLGNDRIDNMLMRNPRGVAVYNVLIDVQQLPIAVIFKQLAAFEKIGFKLVVRRERNK